ncbi:MAG TPA: flavin reductase family protein [Thermotogota bacterium]|mgnify:CR=1 FL=1|nr:flavin reductase family protein [Thermotogota bacterium]HPH11315.1 flavin reductase family protein [Thermotogota bacterium]
MEKEMVGPIAFVYPIPIVLIGSMVAGKANFAEIGDCALAGINPALVVVSINENHYTTFGIREHRCFSLNFPTTQRLKAVDYCGNHSGKEVDKSTLFEIEPGQNPLCPLIDEFPVNLECEVIHDHQIEHRHLYVAKVTQTHIAKNLISREKGKIHFPDLRMLDPILYGLDNAYYTVGEKIGTSGA